MDRIGQPDIGETGGDEDFGFADFRAADADRAALDLPARDDWRLVRLGVGAQSNARFVGQRLDARDVVRDARAIDQNLWREKIGEAHARTLSTVHHEVTKNAKRTKNLLYKKDFVTFVSS